jgi:hypothetical protein
MKKLFLLVAISLAGATVAAAEQPIPPKTHPDSAQWSSVFAKDLSDAVYPPGIWSSNGGVLTATEDKCIWTATQYEDFILDLEFKTESGTNSGVFVYCSDIKNFIPNSVEVQIADDYAAKWAKSPATWRCAAIFGHLAPAKSAVKKPGEWNRMTITCKGPMIYVLLNGEQVNQIDLKKWTSAKKNPDGSDIPPWLSKPLSELPTKGHIGLQGKHAGAPIYFRNLKIKTLD